jgi:hypothetical protein
MGLPLQPAKITTPARTHALRYDNNVDGWSPFVVVALIVLAVLQLLTASGILAFYRLWKRRDEFGFVTKLAAVVVAAFAIACVFGIVAGLIMAFGAIGGEASDPSQKARILAENISRAMNVIALGVIVGVPSAILLYVLTRPRKRSKS